MPVPVSAYSRLKGRIAEGSAVDAAARVLVYIGKAQHRIEERTFDALRKLLQAYPEAAEAEFKAGVREQWAILAVDERAAIEAVPQLLPAVPTVRRAFCDFVQSTAATDKGTGEGTKDRLREMADSATERAQEIAGRAHVRTRHHVNFLQMCASCGVDTLLAR